MNGSTIIELKDIHLSYKSPFKFWQKDTFEALTDINMSLYKGENFGVIGRNGCGKSSLLQILAGIIKPTSGEVLEHTNGPPLSKALLTLGFGFNRFLSGRDNAVLSSMLQGYTKREAEALAGDIKEFSELGDFFEKPVLTYSSGMRSKLGFSAALMTRVDIMLIDETLSVGDELFRKKAEQAMLDMLSGEQTVVFVSHNANQVKRICPRAIWLEQGKVSAAGKTSEVSEEYDSFMKKVKESETQTREVG